MAGANHLAQTARDLLLEATFYGETAEVSLDTVVALGVALVEDGAMTEAELIDIVSGTGLPGAEQTVRDALAADKE